MRKEAEITIQIRRVVFLFRQTHDLANMGARLIHDLKDVFIESLNGFYQAGDGCFAYCKSGGSV